jgi:hypothetical protein
MRRDKTTRADDLVSAIPFCVNSPLSPRSAGSQIDVETDELRREFLEALAVSVAETFLNKKIAGEQSWVRLPRGSMRIPLQ